MHSESGNALPVLTATATSARRESEEGWGVHSENGTTPSAVTPPPTSRRGGEGCLVERSSTQ